MNHRTQVAAVLALTAMLATGCDGDVAAPTGPGGPVIGSIALELEVDTLSVRQTTLLQVTVLSADGDRLVDRAVTFLSSDDDIATISVDGLVTAESPGTATLTAQADDTTATAVLYVRRAASISVAPSDTTLIVDDTLRLAVTVVDVDGAPVANPDLIFSGNIQGVLDIGVDHEGTYFVAVGVGKRVITAETEGLTATVDVSVAALGGFLVKTVSEGVDLDPDGYSIAFEASSVHEERIGLNDSLLISEEDLPPGETWIVRLNGVSENCLHRAAVSDFLAIFQREPLALRLRGEAIVRVTFSVTCFERSSSIAFQAPSGGADADILLLKNQSGSGIVNLTNHPADDVGPALSPDRSRVVFSSNRAYLPWDGYAYDLYSVSADGSDLVRLTSSGFDFVGSQAWSPDGSRIIFTSTRDDPSGEIYVMNADGSGVVRLTNNTVPDESPAWSPDGSSIAFVRWTDGLGNIYRMSAFDGSSIFRVASNGHDPAWSPDGSKIAYGLGNDPWGYDVIPDLAVIGINGTGFVQWRTHLSSTDYPERPSWSPDGKWIAFDRGCCGDTSVMTVVRFEGNRFGESVDIGDGESPSWR